MGRVGHFRRVLALLAAGVGGVGAQPVLVQPAAMSRAGSVDERFQSYNIEMIEVTGGRFWKPYTAGPPSSDLYEYRPPIDLSNVRLRKLAAALGPVFVRVS